MSDLRFDREHDLDVSTRHGEIRAYRRSIVDLDNKSTNGTFVNGERRAAGGSRELKSGDIGRLRQLRTDGGRDVRAAKRATPVGPTVPLAAAAGEPKRRVGTVSASRPRCVSKRACSRSR